MNLRPFHAPRALLAGCLVLSVPLSLMAMPPADGKSDAHDPCEMRERGHWGPPMEPPREGFSGDRPPPFLVGLRLTEDQEDKIFAILHANAPAMREQSKAAHKAREALHDLGRAANYDAGNANTLAQALGKAESQLAVLQAHADHDIYAVLTDEQRRRLAEHESDHEYGHERANGPHRADEPLPR